MPKTVEELEAEVAELRAAHEGAKTRISELNNEAKGHRLNADNARREATEASDRLKSLQADLEKARGMGAEAEAKALEKVKEAEAKAAEAERLANEKAQQALTAAQQRSVNADLRIAAKEMGANDIADVLALLPRDKLKISDDGDVENAAEIMAEFKKSKPHLFGSPSTTSNTNPPPKPKTEAKTATDMSPEEWKAARAKIRHGERV